MLLFKCEKVRRDYAWKLGSSSRLLKACMSNTCNLFNEVKVSVQLQLFVKFFGS